MCVATSLQVPAPAVGVLRARLDVVDAELDLVRVRRSREVQGSNPAPTVFAMA